MLKTALLLAVAAIVGCTANTGGERGGSDPVVEDPPAFGADWAPFQDEGAEALEQADANLARLRALDVFEVGDLVVDAPEGASEAEIREATELAALRLIDLVAVAEPAAGEPGSYLCTEMVDENLAALDALGIVEIEGIIEAVPEGNPACGGAPCQEDIAAADAANYLRAAALDSIARAAEGL